MKIGRELMERCTYRHPSGKIWLKRCEKYDHCDDDCFYCGKDGPMQEALERLAMYEDAGASRKDKLVGGKTTIKEAIHLLDPATTGQAISEIEYYHGLSGKKAAIQAITEACELACEIMRKYEEQNQQISMSGGIQNENRNRR